MRHDARVFTLMLLQVAAVESFACAPHPPPKEERSRGEAQCGDGIIDESRVEVCDDGNLVAGDGCSSICTVESGWTCEGSSRSRCSTFCGDGIRVGAETCDDGNAVTTDGCAGCLVRPGYVCDGASPTHCAARCGDGLVLGDENCDDGNVSSGDGCDARCRQENAWTCNPRGGSCSTICGDGVVIGSETCDDGNTRAGDGCSPACVRVDTWRPILVSVAAPPPEGALATWTGREVIIWGGSDWGTRNFDPKNRTWRTLARSPDITTFNATALWTGRELIVLGAQDFGIGAGSERGGIYDPATNTWRVVSTLNAPRLTPRMTYAWTGREIISWAETNETPRGGLYDPISNTWRPMNTDGEPSARDGYGSGIWNGRELLYFKIVWPDGTTDAHAYDPVRDRWRTLPVDGTPTFPTGSAILASPLLALAGEEVFLFGPDWGGPIDRGARFNMRSETWSTIELETPVVFPSMPSVQFSSGELLLGPEYPELGVRYVPALDAWFPIGSAGAEGISASGQRCVASAGDDVLVFATDATTESEPVWARYETYEHRWTTLWSGGDDLPEPRQAFSKVWTGSELIVWGGHPVPAVNYGLVDESSLRPLTAGWSYSPGTGSWTRLPSENEPDPRYAPILAWTGQEVLVWGAPTRLPHPISEPEIDAGPTNGGRYHPGTKTWRPMSNGGRAPKNDVLAVFTDRELIVFSPSGPDQNQPPFAAYDPERDAFRPIPHPHALLEPVFSAFWTGTEVLFVSAGGVLRYDPAIDAWQHAASEGGPFPTHEDEQAFAGWGSGELMVVVGDRVQVYSPALDAWSQLRLPESARARLPFAAPLFTGAVWMFPPSPHSSESSVITAIYDPATLGWSSSPALNAPETAGDRAYAWIGDALVVWGDAPQGAILPY